MVRPGGAEELHGGAEELHAIAAGQGPLFHGWNLMAVCPRCGVYLRAETLEGRPAQRAAGPYRLATRASASPPGQVQVHRCGGCRGIFFPTGQLGQALRTMQILDVPDAPAAISFQRSEPCICPRCTGREMAVMISRSTGVIYDHCRECGGVWFDAGEVNHFADPLIVLSVLSGHDGAVLPEAPPAPAVTTRPPNAAPGDRAVRVVDGGGEGKPSLVFEVFERRGSTLRYLRRGPAIIKIGRLPSNHIRIEDDEQVSRMHAVIEVERDGPIRLIDLGSVGGTRLDGKKIDSAELAPGDRFQLGRTEILIAIGD